MFSKYLKEDKTLNYQALYNDMYRITGFNQKANRDKLYKEVVDWYEDIKKNKEDSGVK